MRWIALMHLIIAAAMLNGCGGGAPRSQQLIYNLGVSKDTIVPPLKVQVLDTQGAKTVHLEMNGSLRIPASATYGILTAKPLEEADLLVLASIQETQDRRGVDFAAAVIDRKRGVLLGRYQVARSLDVSIGRSSPESEAETFINTVMAICQPAHPHWLAEPVPANVRWPFAIETNANQLEVFTASCAPAEIAPERASAYVAAMKAVRALGSKKSVWPMIAADPVDAAAADKALSGLLPFVQPLEGLSPPERAMAAVAIWNAATLRVATGATPDSIEALTPLLNDAQGQPIPINVLQWSITRSLLPVHQHVKEMANAARRFAGYQHGEHGFNAPGLVASARLVGREIPTIEVVAAEPAQAELPALAVAARPVVEALRPSLKYTVRSEGGQSVRVSTEQTDSGVRLGFDLALTNRTQRLLSLDPSALRGSSPIDIEHIRMGGELVQLGGEKVLQVAPADTLTITLHASDLRQLLERKTEKFELTAFDLPKTVDEAGTVTARDNAHFVFMLKYHTDSVQRLEAQLR